MNVEKVILKEKLNQFADYWHPRIVGELNQQQVKLAKFKGEFDWHSHTHEDEMFLVLEGEFTMQLRDKDIPLFPGEFIIIPKGVEHRPVTNTEASVLLFEPATTLNTGNVKTEKTKLNLDKI